MNWNDTVKEVVLFTKKEKKRYNSPTIGKVIKGAPNFEVSIFKGELIIPSDRLYISESLIKNYERTFKSNGTVDLNTTYNSSDESLAGEGPHKHNFISSKSSNDYSNMEGSFIYTDYEIKVDDEVLLIPIDSTNKWVISSKVVKVGG